jgi:hypothetical protein
MSDQQLTFEQIQNMRAAIDMTIQAMGENPRPRAEVITAIVPLVKKHGDCPSKLASLVLEKMGLSHLRLMDSRSPNAAA